MLALGNAAFALPVEFGVVGLFVGPVMLAIAFALLKEWVGERSASRPRLPFLTCCRWSARLRCAR